MTSRAYTQVARAHATEQTRRAILDAGVSLFYAGDYDVALDRVAIAAGVSTRTILRHFGSKEGLIEAAIADQTSAVEAERAAPPGDSETFVTLLVDHYERRGDDVLGLLAAEDRYPLLRRLADDGRRQHAELVASAFAPDLDGLDDRARAARAALLETVTDVYTWALLRRRSGLGRKATEAAILGLVNHAIGADPR
jgi:AcrR family transcriptional regulator